MISAECYSYLVDVVSLRHGWLVNDMTMVRLARISCSPESSRDDTVKRMVGHG